MRVIRPSLSGEASALEEALAVLNSSGVVAYPTETFYGLGARFDMPGAVQRIYDLKGRPQEKSMSLIISGPEALSSLCLEPGPAALQLMRRCWPGPLTLLLAAREGLPPYATSNDRVAVRVPGESFALKLARAAGFPITATSANPAGMPPAASADMVIEYFGKSDVDLLVDCGDTAGSMPSTIVDASGDRLRLVRDGACGLDPGLLGES